jgi:hypothetical protein
MRPITRKGLKHRPAYVISRSMSEGKLPSAEAACANAHADEIWVPTAYHRQIFRASGVTAKVSVVPGRALPHPPSPRTVCTAQPAVLSDALIRRVCSMIIGPRQSRSMSTSSTVIGSGGSPAARARRCGRRAVPGSGTCARSARRCCHHPPSTVRVCRLPPLGWGGRVCWVRSHAPLRAANGFFDRWERRPTDF